MICALGAQRACANIVNGTGAVNNMGGGLGARRRALLFDLPPVALAEMYRRHIIIASAPARLRTRRLVGVRPRGYRAFCRLGPEGGGLTPSAPSETVGQGSGGETHDAHMYAGVLWGLLFGNVADASADEADAQPAMPARILCIAPLRRAFIAMLGLSVVANAAADEDVLKLAGEPPFPMMVDMFRRCLRHPWRRHSRCCSGQWNRGSAALLEALPTLSERPCRC